MKVLDEILQQAIDSKDWQGADIIYPELQSALQELQIYRAGMPKVRLKLQMLAGQIGFNMEDIAFSTNSHRDTQQRCALSALALLDSLETEGSK